MRTRRDGDELRAEIIGRLGFLPPFFEPALDNPGVLEHLWNQTQSAYIESPLPPVLKEVLFARLSRYCALPYCIICHACALRPLGITAREILELLEASDTASGLALDQIVAELDRLPAPLPDWPERSDPLFGRLCSAAMEIYRSPFKSARLLGVFARLFGTRTAEHRRIFLSYVRTCHEWIEAHPELAYEADRRVLDHLPALLKEEPRLAEFFRNYQERVASQEIVLDAADPGHAQERLAVSELRYRNLIDQLPAVIYTAAFDEENSTLFISSQVEKMLGYPPERFTTDSRFLTRNIHPDDRQRLLDELVEFREPGRRFQLDYRFIAPDGRLVWVRDQAAQVRDASGRPLFIQGVLLDITELRAAEEALFQSQKMEAIGQLAGGIAHDFNNLLTAVIGHSELIRPHIAGNPEARDSLDHILSAADRARKLTQGLLAFGRKQVINPRPVDINEIVRDVVALLSRTLGADIELRLRCGENPLVVMAEGVQIEQVLINLATNARDAMPQGGSLTICTEPAWPEEDFVRRAGMAEADHYAVLSVSDSGIGMDEALRGRIFEPFFTTKEVGRGTGLGLAIVYGIVKQHGGTVDVLSHPGAGSTFRVYLPAIGEVEDRRTTAEPPRRTERGSEVVLLAEDEQQVRTLLSKILRRAGYEVIEVADGEAAVARYLENRDRIAICVFDLMMPKMTGRAAYEEILRSSPGAKALFLSGYAADVVERRGMLARGMTLLAKPIAPSELLAKLRELLDRA